MFRNQSDILSRLSPCTAMHQPSTARLHMHLTLLYHQTKQNQDEMTIKRILAMR